MAKETNEKPLSPRHRYRRYCAICDRWNIAEHLNGLLMSGESTTGDSHLGYACIAKAPVRFIQIEIGDTPTVITQSVEEIEHPYFWVANDGKEPNVSSVPGEEHELHCFRCDSCGRKVKTVAHEEDVIEKPGYRRTIYQVVPCAFCKRGNPGTLENPWPRPPMYKTEVQEC